MIKLSFQKLHGTRWNEHENLNKHSESAKHVETRWNEHENRNKDSESAKHVETRWN